MLRPRGGPEGPGPGLGPEAGGPRPGPGPPGTRGPGRRATGPGPFCMGSGSQGLLRWPVREATGGHGLRDRFRVQDLFGATPGHFSMHVYAM